MSQTDYLFKLEATRLLEVAREQGGFTVQGGFGVQGEAFAHRTLGKGFAVSLPEYEIVATELALSYAFEGVLSGLEQARKDTDNPQAHWVGCWYDTEGDRYYFDISIIFSDREEARKFAKEYNQLAIFNFETMTTERLGDNDNNHA